MENCNKAVVAAIVSEARNLELTYKEQMTVVKVIKAICAGDNALAFALLIASEKLRDLVVAWSNATAYAGV